MSEEPSFRKSAGGDIQATQPGQREPLPALITVTRVVYRLHALSLAAGVLAAVALIAGRFAVVALLGALLFGSPSIVAVVINYLRRAEVRDTWLESHFSWQIRTYWIGGMAASMMFPIAIPLMVLLVYSPFGEHALVMAGELARMVYGLGLGVNPNSFAGLHVLLFFLMLVVGIAIVCFLPVRVWEIYRITRGWHALNAGKPIKPRS